MHKTSLSTLSKVIISLRIPPSSTVMIHSSLLKFGVIEKGVEGLFKCIMESLSGDITILMPAFNFSFADTGYWSATNTKSEMGVLTEYFRNQNGTIRTIHPFHSVVAFGKYADDFADCDSFSSFGINSPFEKMLALDAYNLSLGTEFIGGATFVHHTEEVCRVPYRHYKDFPGEIYDKKEERVDKIFSMYVRDITENHEYINDWERVFKDLCQEGCFDINYLGPAKIMLSSINKTHNVLKYMINTDAYYAAKLIKT